MEVMPTNQVTIYFVYQMIWKNIQSGYEQLAWTKKCAHKLLPRYIYTYSSWSYLLYHSWLQQFNSHNRNNNKCSYIVGEL